MRPRTSARDTARRYVDAAMRLSVRARAESACATSSLTSWRAAASPDAHTASLCVICGSDPPSAAVWPCASSRALSVGRSRRLCRVMPSRDSVCSLAARDGAQQLSGPHLVEAAESAGARAPPSTSPVSWDDIAGLQGVKDALRRAVEWPLRHADAFSRMGLSAPRGVLMHGPPGCSKTTLARAAATAAKASFFAVAGAELYSSYVGEAERILRGVFSAARAAPPSIVFLDEIDALVGSRDAISHSDSVQARVLSTLLNEMDGVDTAPGSVLVIGATNRPDLVDKALLRPGRFDVLLEVTLPSEPERADILRLYCRKMQSGRLVASDQDIDEVAAAAACAGMSGADLQAVVREAAMTALRECVEDPLVGRAHLMHAAEYVARRRGRGQ